MNLGKTVGKKLFSAFMGMLLLVPFCTASDVHVVSPSDLQKQAVTATQTRQENLHKVREFLSSPLANKVMAEHKISPEQVKTAAASLSDQELAQLAARADKAQHDFAAGSLGPFSIAIIVLGVVLVILIVVLAS
jgi:hypothetical protein